MTLGQKLKKLRAEKGLTQKDLADQLHVTFQTVSKWESDLNEPDIATLRELAKLYDCSIDYLVSETEEESKNVEVQLEPISKTIIIHQKELHVCERCKIDIPDDELEIEDVLVRHASRGRSAQYRQAYYHKTCLEELHKEKVEQKRIEKAYKASKSKKICFGWSIAGGIVALTVSLLVLLLNPDCKASIAFPSISTGIFGYPVEEAAEICAKIVCEYKSKHLKYGYMCILNDAHNEAVYNCAFQKYSK